MKAGRGKIAEFGFQIKSDLVYKTENQKGWMGDWGMGRWVDRLAFLSPSLRYQERFSMGQASLARSGVWEHIVVLLFVFGTAGR